MSGTEHADPLLRFGTFELDLASGELRRQGRLVQLTGQPMRVLILLASRPGQVVTRVEIQQAIWGDDTHVDFDAGLSTCINQIRSALGDRASSPRFIETVPRKGYRFIAMAGESTVQQAPPQIAPGRPVVAAAALVVVITALVAPICWRSSARPIPVAVFPVDVDASTPHLAPLSATLTHAITGTLVSELGDRGRVASQLVVREYSDKPLHEMTAAGMKYVLLVTLRSLGGPVLVHLKLVNSTGAVQWAADRSVPFDQLEKDQLRIAIELAKEVAHEIIGS